MIQRTALKRASVHGCFSGRNSCDIYLSRGAKGGGNGSVHLDLAGIILDGGTKPIGWSFEFIAGTGERYAGRLPPESSNANWIVWFLGAWEN